MTGLNSHANRNTVISIMRVREDKTANAPCHTLGQLLAFSTNKNSTNHSTGRGMKSKIDLDASVDEKDETSHWSGAGRD